MGENVQTTQIHLYVMEKENEIIKKIMTYYSFCFCNNGVALPYLAKNIDPDDVKKIKKYIILISD